MDERNSAVPGVDPAVVLHEGMAARATAQEAEYGEWVAVEFIQEGNALAYAPGHPVPKSNVARHGYDRRGLVRRRSELEAEQREVAVAAQAADVVGPVEVGPYGTDEEAEQ